MNASPENIIVNSCEYTPIYLIPSTSVNQPGSFIVTQSNQTAQIPKPVASNLKTFYENSGKLESSILSSPKPRILRKQSSNVVGNNLKLASFLLRKAEPVAVTTGQATLPAIQPNITSVHPKQPIPPLNIAKPAVPVTPITTACNVTNNLPRVEIDRKIVRVGTIPNTKRTHHPRVLSKTMHKPKELKEKSDPNLSKHTSVQLIKLGETYHSLNQLSEDQMKIVNKALKMFSDPEKIPKEPAYDPVTNTKFIYKVVSPRDLAVVGGRNKVMIKKKNEAKKKALAAEEPKEDEPVEPKVTRSGRTVKRPKQMRPNESPHKPKKKIGSVVNCFQCSAEFCSFYRLQRHYEMYPTHIPARIHSNLFHCLLAIIKGGSEDDQANIFIQQLEQLIEKIGSLLPCLLKKIDGKEGKQCTINEDIGRIFGMNPGKYNFNIDALNCVKDKDGHCIHNPAQKNNQFMSDVKPSQIWLSKQNEEIANNEAEVDDSSEDCARINSVDKWPTLTKRIWKLKQQKQKMNVKKMTLLSESEQPIDLGIEDVIMCCKPNETSAINEIKSNGSQEIKNELSQIPVVEQSSIRPGNEHCKPTPKFHSAHFDIRSSPIKLPSSLVRKFQLNPEKITNYEVQILQPLSTEGQTVDQTQCNSEVHEICTENVVLQKEPVTNNNEINFETPKNWHSNPSINNESADEIFLKSNIIFDTPEKHALIDSALMVNDKENCLFDTPSKANDLIAEANFLEIIDKSNSLIQHSLMHVNDKPNNIFENNQTLEHIKEQQNGFYEQSSMHIKPKSNKLIGSSAIEMKDRVFESALLHVKERSNNLFDTELLQIPSKPNSLIEPLVHDKDESILFDTGMEHVKERSNSLFESSLMNMKGKDSLIDPTLLQVDNSNIFNSATSHQKEDELMQQSLVHNNDATRINGAHMMIKNNVTNPESIDMNQADSLSNTDSQLQGQSVLNFLDSLGNESLGLSYPETDIIRNNPVDFQLDLFSFSNS